MHLITYIINQLVLSCFNYTNSSIDAYLIFKHKKIAHGVNFVAYLLIACFAYFVNTEYQTFDFIVWLLGAFCNRQLTFDIPLNLRRGLKWDYVSLDNPPKSLFDRVEIFVAGYNGRILVYTYAALLIVCLIIKIVFQCLL